MNARLRPSSTVSLASVVAISPKGPNFTAAVHLHSSQPKGTVLCKAQFYAMRCTMRQWFDNNATNKFECRQLRCQDAHQLSHDIGVKVQRRKIKVCCWGRTHVIGLHWQQRIYDIAEL